MRVNEDSDDIEYIRKRWKGARRQLRQNQIGRKARNKQIYHLSKKLNEAIAALSTVEEMLTEKDDLLRGTKRKLEFEQKAYSARQYINKFLENL